MIPFPIFSLPSFFLFPKPWRKTLGERRLRPWESDTGKKVFKPNGTRERERRMRQDARRKAKASGGC